MSGKTILVRIIPEGNNLYSSRLKSKREGVFQLIRWLSVLQIWEANFMGA